MSLKLSPWPWLVVVPAVPVPVAAMADGGPSIGGRDKRNASSMMLMQAIHTVAIARVTKGPHIVPKGNTHGQAPHCECMGKHGTT